MSEVGINAYMQGGNSSVDDRSYMMLFMSVTQRMESPYQVASTHARVAQLHRVRSPKIVSDVSSNQNTHFLYDREMVTKWFSCACNQFGLVRNCCQQHKVKQPSAISA
eukprot:2758743-Amphidinium_carterae.1